MEKSTAFIRFEQEMILGDFPDKAFKQGSPFLDNWLRRWRLHVPFFHRWRRSIYLESRFFWDTGNIASRPPLQKCVTQCIKLVVAPLALKRPLRVLTSDGVLDGLANLLGVRNCKLQCHMIYGHIESEASSPSGTLYNGAYGLLKFCHHCVRIVILEHDSTCTFARSVFT